MKGRFKNICWRWWCDINNHSMMRCGSVQFMGNMDVLSFISDGFNIYFPIAIVLLCTLTFFGIGTRVLHMLGFQQFIGDDDMTQEMIDEGVELVKRGKFSKTSNYRIRSKLRKNNIFVYEKIFVIVHISDIVTHVFFKILRRILCPISSICCTKILGRVEVPSRSTAHPLK